MYKITILVYGQVTQVYEFNDKESARECFYKNNQVWEQYTRLEVNGKEIRSIKSIEKVLGKDPFRLY